MLPSNIQPVCLTSPPSLPIHTMHQLFLDQPFKLSVCVTHTCCKDFIDVTLTEVTWLIPRIWIKLNIDFGWWCGDYVMHNGKTCKKHKLGMHRDGGDAKNCAAHTHGGAQKYSNLIHFTELHYMHQRWKSKKLTIFGFNNFEGGHILVKWSPFTVFGAIKSWCYSSRLLTFWI